LAAGAGVGAGFGATVSCVVHEASAKIVAIAADLPIVDIIFYIIPPNF
jgi:hypothetical protein